MAADNAKLVSDIKSAKIALKVCRTQVTKSITKFEQAAKDLQKNEQGSKAKQLRLAASLLEAHEILRAKVKKMETANEVTIQAIIMRMKANYQRRRMNWWKIMRLRMNLIWKIPQRFRLN